MLKNFFRDEEGMGTVELVLIIAALVAVAILFRNAIMGFINDALGNVFGDKTKKALDIPEAE